MAPTDRDQTVIVFEPARCTGCRYCEVACAVWHCGIIDVTKARIRVLVDPESAGERYAAVNCQHCDAPVCVSACPSAALAKDEQTGWVMGNSSKCIGCELCVLSCPLAVPFFDSERGIAVKCDFCSGDPQCVRHCSPGALRLLPRDEAALLHERLYLGGTR